MKIRARNKDKTIERVSERSKTEKRIRERYLPQISQLKKITMNFDLKNKLLREIEFKIGEDIEKECKRTYLG